MGSGLVCGTAVSAALAGGTVDPYFTFMLREFPQQTMSYLLKTADCTWFKNTIAVKTCC
jgi:hypothetical protein